MPGVVLEVKICKNSGNKLELQIRNKGQDPVLPGAMVKFVDHISAKDIPLKELAYSQIAKVSMFTKEPKVDVQIEYDTGE